LMSSAESVVLVIDAGSIAAPTGKLSMPNRPAITVLSAGALAGSGSTAPPPLDDEEEEEEEEEEDEDDDDPVYAPPPPPQAASNASTMATAAALPILVPRIISPSYSVFELSRTSMVP